MITGLNPYVGAIIWTLAVVTFSCGVVPPEPGQPQNDSVRMISGGLMLWALTHAIAYWAATA